jgi:hypothetical protein
MFVAILVCSIGDATETPVLRDAVNVSLVQILTNPEQYSGKVVTTAGFLSEFGNHLFLSRELRALDDFASGIHVCNDCDVEEISKVSRALTGGENRYARLTGLLKLRSDGTAVLISVYQIVGLRNYLEPGPPNPSRICWTNPAAIPPDEESEN